MEREREKTLIEKAKADPRYFKEIYNEHYKHVFLFVYKRVADKEIAADLVSQVFLKALLNLKRYHYYGAPISAWLMRIAMNELNDYYRKTARQRVVVITDDVVENLTEDFVYSTEEMLQRLTQALQYLKSETLQLIELRFFEQRSYKEIAAILQLTENNAKVKTYRAIEKLRKHMRDGKI